MKSTKYFLILLLSFALLIGGALLAQEHQHKKQESKSGHSHAKAETHGGEAAMTKAHHFEVVWMPDHVMVYLYDASQKPLAAKGVTGEVVFKFKDGKEEKATLALMEAGKMMTERHGEGGKMEHHAMMQGKMSKEEMEAMHQRMSNQDHLVVKVNLANVKVGEVKATFTLKGLPDKTESEATFTSKHKMMSMTQHKPEKHEQHH